MAVAPGSGVVAVTLPSAISARSIIAIACAVVQTDGSGSTQPGITVQDDLSNSLTAAISGGGSGGGHIQSCRGCAWKRDIYSH
jgi:hypothetical protein